MLDPRLSGNLEMFEISIITNSEEYVVVIIIAHKLLHMYIYYTLYDCNSLN